MYWSTVEDSMYMYDIIGIVNFNNYLNQKKVVRQCFRQSKKEDIFLPPDLEFWTFWRQTIANDDHTAKLGHFAHISWTEKKLFCVNGNTALGLALV